MGHIILLSELERARPARPRHPLPVGGATISLFLGVRYERWDKRPGREERKAFGPEPLKPAAVEDGASEHERRVHEVL
jgi:hypothetical protein